MEDFELFSIEQICHLLCDLVFYTFLENTVISLFKNLLSSS